MLTHLCISLHTLDYFKQLIPIVDPVSWCWHHMEVSYDAYVSEEHTASIMRAIMKSAVEADDLYRDGRWIRPQ